MIKHALGCRGCEKCVGHIPQTVTFLPGGVYCNVMLGPIGLAQGRESPRVSPYLPPVLPKHRPAARFRAEPVRFCLSPPPAFPLVLLLLITAVSCLTKLFLDALCSLALSQVVNLDLQLIMFPGKQTGGCDFPEGCG